jgi:RHS repeat-associated protein
MDAQLDQADCRILLWEWQYHLKDHLGNVRVTFSDADLNGVIDNATEIMEEYHYYPFGMQTEGNWQSTASAGDENRYRYNGKELVEEFGLGWYDYGARWYDAAIGRFTSVDPLADDPSLVSYSPYVYVVNNPVLHTDPDGRCPPWVCGAIAGAAVEAGSQVIFGMLSGKSFTESVKSIDVADVVAAGVEGGITAGGSVFKRIAVGIASEVVQATLDAEVSDVQENGVNGISVETDGGNIAKDATIGILAAGAGEVASGTLKALTNSKATKALSQVNGELKKSMQGSQGQATRLSKQAALSTTINGNKVVAEAAGTIATETIDKNN